MFQDHYVNWRNSRLSGIKKYIQNSYFTSKTLLEVGCGYADLGNEFFKMGAKVTCSDARIEHINVVRERYPELNTMVLDCDNYNINSKYDIIV